MVRIYQCYYAQFQEKVIEINFAEWISERAFRMLCLKTQSLSLHYVLSFSEN